MKKTKISNRRKGPMKHFLTIITILFFAVPVYAGGTVTDLGGGFKTYVFDDGTTAHSSKCGNMETITFDDGSSAVATEMDDTTTIYNFSNGTTGTSTNLGGGVEVYQFDNGCSGTSTDIGGGMKVFNDNGNYQKPWE
ncbi:MAG: hypothetical protein DRH07_06430 [Deltaproteobacteria bacterium]|nr:MAG: hypothetical protein DRH07_06430 [Deltaproteobacteria bacterium]